MAPFNEKSINPPKFKRIKSAIDVPARVLPKQGEANELYVAEDGTDIQFWDDRKGRFKSTQHKGDDRFLLSTEKTEGYFDFGTGNFNSPHIDNRIEANKQHSLNLSGIPKDKQLQDGLRAYYKLNDSGGSNIVDSIGGYEGQVATGTAYTSVSSGVIDSAVELSSDTSINLGSALHVEDGDFTISVWFKPTSTSVNGSEQILSTGTSKHVTVTYNGNKKIELNASDSSNSVSVTSDLIPNRYTWTNIIVTRSSTTFRLWINGTQTGSDSNSSIGVVSESGNSVLGASNGESDGLNTRQLDEFGVWTAGLSTNDIHRIVSPVAVSPGYYANIEGAESGKITSYYTFDDAGSPYKDSYGTHDGSSVGAGIAIDKGKVGNCLYYPGNEDQHVNIGSALDVNQDQAFTIAFWFLLGGSSDKPTFYDWEKMALIQVSQDNGTTDILNIEVTNPVASGNEKVGIQTSIADSNGENDVMVETGGEVSIHGWHHVATGRDASGNMFVRVDGGTLTEASSASTTRAFSGNGYLGLKNVNRGGAPFWMDEVAIWKGTRLPDNVIDKFYNTSGLEPSPHDKFLDYGTLGYKVRAFYALDGDTTDATENYDGSGFNGYFAQGIRQQAAQFASTSDHIKTGEAFNVDGNDLTLGLWTHFSDISTEQYLVDADNGTQGWSLRLTASGELQFTTRKSSTSTQKTSSISGGLSTGQWYFIAIVRRDTELDMYVYEETSNTPLYSNTFTGIDSGSLKNSTGNTTIAHTSTGMVGGGKIDHVSFFDGSVGQSIVDNLFNEGEGLPFERLEKWNFLRSKHGMRMNAFAQVEDSYLEYDQDMTTFQSYTISAWVKPENFFDGNNPAYFIWIGDDTQMDSPEAKNGYVAYDHVNQTISINGNNTNHTVNFPLQVDYWYHFLLERNAGNYLALYIDNKPVLTSSDITGLSSGKLLRIGAGPTNTNGTALGTSDSLVDQVTVFQQTLSSKYRDIVYNKGLGMDIGTDITRLASADQVSSSSGGGQSSDLLLRYLHSYYSFDHKNDPHQHSPLDTFSDWQRDDAGDHDGQLVVANTAQFGVSNTAKLGTQSMQSPGDDQGIQQFFIGAGDPSVNASGNPHSFSISFWFQTPDTATNGDTTLYRTDTENDSTSLYLIQNASRLKLQKGTNPPIFTSSTFIGTGKWYNVILVYNATGTDKKFTLYVDGTIEKTSTVSDSFSYTGGSGAFMDDTSNTISYMIDELGNWAGFALEQTQIDLLYNDSSATNDFIYQPWHYYPAQRDIHLKDHNVERVREPAVSHHAATKAYTDAGDFLLRNAHLYYNFQDTKDKVDGYHFSTRGSASLQPNAGVVHDAVQFNGGSDHLDLDNGLQSLTAYDFSLSFFVKLSDRSTDQILVHSNDSNISGTVKAFFQLQFLSSDNQLQFSSDGMNINNGSVSSNADITSTNNVITDSDYHHIVVRRRGQGPPNKPNNNSPNSSQPVEIFVDGLKVASDTIPLRSLTTTDPYAAEFGHSSGLQSSQNAPPSTISHSDTPMQGGGLISEFGVWNRWLESSEITYLYHNKNAVEIFMDMVWSSFPAQSTLDLNGYAIKNVGTPTDDSDAVPLTDLTEWRSGTLDVRQTVAHSHIDIRGRPAMLTAVPPTGSYITTNQPTLAENLKSAITFENYKDGDTKVEDEYRRQMINVNNANGENKALSPENINGNAIQIQTGNYIDLEDRLEFDDANLENYTVSFLMKVDTLPSGGSGKVVILTDDYNHPDDLSTEPGTRLFYDKSDGEMKLELSNGTNIQTRDLSEDFQQWNLFSLVFGTWNNRGECDLYINFNQYPLYADNGTTVTSQGVNRSRLQAPEGIIQIAQLCIWPRDLKGNEPYHLVPFPWDNGIKLQSMVPLDGDLDDKGEAGGTVPYTGGTPQFTDAGKGVNGQGKALYKENDGDYLKMNGKYDKPVRFPADTDSPTRVISAWFHLNNVNREIVLIDSQSGESSTTNSFRVHQKQRNIQLNVYGSVITDDDPIPANGGWVHVGCARISGSEVQLIVNGKLIGEPILSGSYGSGVAHDLYARYMVDMPADSNERLDLCTYAIVNDFRDTAMTRVIARHLYNQGKGLQYSDMSSSGNALPQNPGTSEGFLQSLGNHHFTFGDGVKNGYQLNVGVSSSNSFDYTPSTINPDTVYYLYVEYDENTQALTNGTTTLAPKYSLMRPQNPSTGQYWYPIDHRKRGEVYDGSNWQPVLRLFVGEAKSDGNGRFPLESVHTYAYQGRYVSKPVKGTADDNYIAFTHNIGTKLVHPLFIAQSLTDTEEYEPGDEIVLTGTHNASYSTYTKKNGLESVLSYQSEGLANFTKAMGDAVSEDIEWDQVQVSLYAQRMF